MYFPLDTCQGERNIYWQSGWKANKFKTTTAISFIVNEHGERSWLSYPVNSSNKFEFPLHFRPRLSVCRSACFPLPLHILFSLLLARNHVCVYVCPSEGQISWADFSHRTYVRTCVRAYTYGCHFLSHPISHLSKLVEDDPNHLIYMSVPTITSVLRFTSSLYPLGRI